MQRYIRNRTDQPADAVGDTEDGSDLLRSERTFGVVFHHGDLGIGTKREGKGQPASQP